MLTQKERGFETEWYLFGVAKACALWNCVSNGMWMALRETQPHVVEEGHIEGDHPLPDGCICIALMLLHANALQPKTNPASFCKNSTHTSAQINRDEEQEIQAPSTLG
jgi:hypothetical protein